MNEILLKKGYSRLTENLTTDDCYKSFIKYEYTTIYYILVQGIAPNITGERRDFVTKGGPFVSV